MKKSKEGADLHCILSMGGKLSDFRLPCRRCVHGQFRYGVDAITPREPMTAHLHDVKPYEQGKEGVAMDIQGVHPLHFLLNGVRSVLQ